MHAWPKIVPVALLFFIRTCALVAQTSTLSGLVGTSWQLVKFQGGDDKTLVPDNKSKYTVACDNDSVSVRIDCNRGHGSWKSSGPNQIEFGPMALTRAMCPPAELNERLSKDWGYVRAYVLRDGHLFLSLMADAGTYEFEPAPVNGSGGRGKAGPPLERTDWKLIEVGGTAVGAQQREAHFVLDPRPHHVSGSDGCNRLMGSYQLKAEQLAFRQIATTMMACPSGMDTAKAFTDALNKVQGWKITGSQLELLDGEGQVVARMERRPIKK